MNQNKVVPLEALYRAIRDIENNENQKGCICNNIIEKFLYNPLQMDSIYNICSFCPLQKLKNSMYPFDIFCSINDKQKVVPQQVVHLTGKAIMNFILTYEIKGDKEKLLNYLVKKFPNLLLEET